MRRWIFVSLFLILSGVILFKIYSPSKDRFVTVKLQNQWGNQLFQIAAAYAYSLDHNVPLILPQLAGDHPEKIPNRYRQYFAPKISHDKLPAPPFVWKEGPLHRFKPIPKKSHLQITGYFANEKFFGHRRKEILELFAPPVELRKQILAKYPILTSSSLTVGVQIRDYRQECPTGSYHPTHGRDYYAKAFSLFPDDAVFIVSSNNLSFAKECSTGLKNHVIYLQESDDIAEFYTLTFCKNFIISNSTFGWWAAWLSNAPHKTVVAPAPWFAPPYTSKKSRNILPSETIVIPSAPL